MISALECRNDIPILKKEVYLDCAATCPIPRPVVDAILDYWENYPYNYAPDLAFFKGSSRVKERGDEARDNAARLLNASSDEIVFTKNTTEAINIVANGMKWKRGDEVIISNIEHQSNHIPWLRLVKTRGVNLKIVKADSEGVLSPEKFGRAITRRTKLISTLHASNVFGSIQNIESIGILARERGVKFLVDAAQTAGRVPIDVKRIPCDFVAICGRKSLMGPQGTGILYGERESLNELEPDEIGGVAASLTGERDYKLSDIPHRFHAGIYNAMGIIGLGKGIEYVTKSIGMNRLRSRVRSLTRDFLSGLGDIPEARAYGPTNLEIQNGVVSFNLRGFDSKEVARRLDKERNVALGSGPHGSLSAMKHLGIAGTVRASFHYYNTKGDVESLLSGLEKLTK